MSDSAATDQPSHHEYIKDLLIAACVGVPASIAAWAYLQALREVQDQVWDDLPRRFGYDSLPWWWVLGALGLAGLITAFAVTRMPGHGGHSPLEGLSLKPIDANQLPSIILATFASLSLGAVLGPEAPLIAIGIALGVMAVKMTDRLPSAQIAMVAGCFAALSTVFGSPLVAAFMMMEMIGLGGQKVARILVPGLLAAGIGSLVFTGLGSWTGLASPAQAEMTLPHMGAPDAGDIIWAIVIGLGAAILIRVILTLGLTTGSLVTRKPAPAIVACGLLIAVLAILFEALTPHGAIEVLLSGEAQMGPLVDNADQWTRGALLALVLFKAGAYFLSLAAFRGGPIFPAMFLGAAAGLLLADLPGLGTTPAIAAAMGGLTVAVFRFPMSAVLLVAFFLSSAGHDFIPIVIIAVVTSHVFTEILPKPAGLPLPFLRPASATESPG